LLYRTGRPDKAKELAALAVANSPAESVEAQALSRAASATVMASQDPDAALDLSLAALRRVPAEMPNLRGDMYRIVGNVYHARGDREPGDAALTQALQCYRAKGNLAAAAHLG
jgi:ATP/maltotriose-dependent transcriptional regulator MalT